MLKHLNTKPAIQSTLSMQTLWGGLLLIMWALWWGGLSFYAIVVVPIGTDMIGSVEQGFITQKVTHWHNLSMVVFVVALAIEAGYRGRRALRLVVALLALINIALWTGHALLSNQMDFKEHSVPSSFYAQHAIYLWITAAEWFLGISIAFFLLTHSHYPFRGQSTETL